MSGRRRAPAALPWGKSWYPFNRILAGSPRAGLDGFGETPMYEMVKRVWEKRVLFLMLRDPEKYPTLREIDPHPLRTQLND